MFTKVSNASKAAFIWCVRRLQQQGTRLIDCQVQTPHLMSLGAELMPRARFLEWLPQG
jgi:leucyl/phenylalanyl-tRNA--protein transferase